jgi:hypothetical protein
MRFRFQQDQAAADYAQGLCVDMGVYDRPRERHRGIQARTLD